MGPVASVHGQSSLGVCCMTGLGVARVHACAWVRMLLCGWEHLVAFVLGMPLDGVCTSQSWLVALNLPSLWWAAVDESYWSLLLYAMLLDLPI